MIAGLISLLIAFGIMGGAAVELAVSNLSISSNLVQSQEAFNIAESGINYYMWHLNHNATDYKDGQSTPTTPDPTLGYGPYTHTYSDTNAINRGTYTLWI